MKPIPIWKTLWAIASGIALGVLWGKGAESLVIGMLSVIIFLTASLLEGQVKRK